MTALAYDVKGAAALCGLSPDSIKRAIESGALRAKALNATAAAEHRKSEKVGKLLIRHDDLAAWLDGLEDA